MKTFDDLEFELHPNVFMGFNTKATMHFDNGYGVSVITGDQAYSDSEHKYELAVLKGDEICYSTDITDDVLGHLDEDGVTAAMIKVQALKEADNVSV